MKRTVLIIEDEVNLLNVYSLFLTKKGFNVLTAQNGNEGLQIILKQEVDLVISDINLPHKSGLVLIKQIRRILRYRQIPVIILSGGSTKENVFRGVELGVYAFLTKPCGLEKMYETVESAFSSNKSQNNNGHKKVLKFDSHKSVLMVYKGVQVTDNLYEYMSEHYSRITIEHNVQKIEALLEYEDIDLLIMEITSLADPYYILLNELYDQYKFVELPTIIISENKERISQSLDYFQFKVDKIMKKPFSYSELLKVAGKITDSQYLSKKVATCKKVIETIMKENTDLELKTVKQLRNKIGQLHAENDSLTTSDKVEREKKYFLMKENIAEIREIVEQIKVTEKQFKVRNHSLVEAGRRLSEKLKAGDGAPVSA